MFFLSFFIFSWCLLKLTQIQIQIYQKNLFLDAIVCVCVFSPYILHEILSTGNNWLEIRITS